MAERRDFIHVYEGPEARFQRDPEFRTLVSYLEACIHRATFSPSEIREAATLAAIHHELRSAVNPFLRDQLGLGVPNISTGTVPAAGPPPAVIVDGTLYVLEPGEAVPRG